MTSSTNLITLLAKKMAKTSSTRLTRRDLRIIFIIDCPNFEVIKEELKAFIINKL